MWSLYVNLLWLVYNIDLPMRPIHYDLRSRRQQTLELSSQVESRTFSINYQSNDPPAQLIKDRESPRTQCSFCSTWNSTLHLPQHHICQNPYPILFLTTLGFIFTYLCVIWWDSWHRPHNRPTLRALLTEPTLHFHTHIMLDHPQLDLRWGLMYGSQIQCP